MKFSGCILAVWLLGFVAPARADGTGTGLTGEYFATNNFSGTKSIRVDAVVNFDWGTGSPGVGGLGTNNFSVRWSGQLEPRYSDTYTFYVTADDGATLWVNDRLIVSRLLSATPAQMAGQIALKAGQRVNIRLEYVERTNTASIVLEWASTNQTREVIPASQLYTNTLPAERGSILREHWANLPGTAITNLTGYTNYPNLPDGRENFITFECLQTNWATNVGTHLTGYLMPTTNGVYNFAVAASDTAELWLSTNASPTNRQLIAYVTNATAFRDWSNQVGQISGGISLVGWQKYYIELLHKAGTNNNHYSVAWQPPGATQFNIIGGDNLIPVGLNSSLPPQTNIFNTLAQSHPRLFATAERFAWLKQQIASNPTGQPAQWYASIFATATNLLNTNNYPPVVFNLDIRSQILTQSRTVKARMYQLGLAWKISGDTNIAERAWIELNAAGNFPDWNPVNSFLDTAEMTAAVAVGYDWFYEYWNTNRANFLITNIVTKGLLAGLTNYQKNVGWSQPSGNNWNLVCNGGLTVGALAVGTNSPIASAVLTNAIPSCSAVMQHYLADNGAWYEGPGYWDYACDYNFRMCSSLQSALGSDYGISTTNGYFNAGLFAVLLDSAGARNFNFSDAGSGLAGASQGPYMMWWARRFNVPAYAAYQRTNNTADALSALWWDGRGGDPVSENIGSDILFVGPTLNNANYLSQNVGVFRSSWGDANETFLAFKGGNNGASHGDLDAGTFVLEALGNRWAVDLGADNYALTGYFDTNPNSATNRWDYYRMRAEGQNTLVINPGNGPDAALNTVAPVLNFQSKSSARALTVMDLTPAVTSNSVQRAWRGFQLFGPQRKQVLIQDEITGATNATVWWFMHYLTNGTQVTLSSDSNSVTMTQGNSRLWGKILSSGSTFQVMNALPLPTSPNPSGQSSNANIQKLAIKLTGVTNTTIAVWFVPLTAGQNPPVVAPTLVPLAQWQVPDTNPPVAVDGYFTTPQNAAVNADLSTLVTDTATPPSNLVYTVTAPTNGVVTLLGDGHTAQFTPATSFYGTGQFLYTATDTNGNSSTAAVVITVLPATWYWDTAVTAGLQPGNGIWDGVNSNWSSTVAGSNPLLTWPTLGNDAVFIGGGSTYTVTVNGPQNVNQIATTNGTWVFNGGALNHANGAMTITANADTTLNSPLTISADLTKLGTNRLTLGAPAVFPGDVFVNAGTLRIATNNALPPTATLNLGNTNGTVGQFELNGYNQTVDSLNFQSLSPATNSVSITAGNTLTVGNTNGGMVFGVGNYGTAIGGITATTCVSFVRGGSLVVSAPTGAFSIESSGTNNAGTAQAFVNLSGLSNFTANVASFTACVVGGKPNNVSGQFNLTLATNNSITVPSLVLGDSNDGFGTNNVNLGANTVFNVNSLAFIGGRYSGMMSFQSGSSSNLTIRGAVGGTSRADIFIADQVNFSGLGSGGGGSSICIGTLDCGAATVDARIDQLTLGIGASVASQTYGTATGTFIFGGNNSSVDINNAYLGYATSNSTVATSGNSPTYTGTLTMNGGTLTVNSNFFLGYSADDDLGNAQNVAGVFNLNGGTATVSSNLFLGYATNSTGIVSGALNLSNGTFIVNADIVSVGNTATGSVSLVGATLNLNGRKIGSAAKPINLVAGSGTLMSVGEINAGGPLVKTGIGTLTLSGTNTYSGVTTINAGTLLVNGNSSACTNMVTVSTNATFGGAGVMGGNVIVNKGGKLTPGGGLSSVGTLTLTNTLALNGGSLFYEMANFFGGTNDLVVVGNSLSLGATNAVFLSGKVPAGDFQLMTFAATNGPGTFVLGANYTNASLVINPTNLVLHVGAGGGVFGLTWKGTVNGTWDTTVLNWTNGTVTTNFNAGDYVFFDDTLAKNPVITNATPTATVAPGAVVFNNSLTNYTISANISGTGSLTKNGLATVTLTGTNSYAGNTTVNAGTLVITNGGTINSPLATLNIGAGATTAAITLTNGSSSITVQTLLATNNICSGPTNSVFNFNGGTLTTSNYNGLAANILLASNASWTINGNWNLNGGTNLIENVNTNGNGGGTVSFGNGVNGLQMNVNPNAVLWLAVPDNSVATNIVGLVVGNNNATNNVLTVNNGTLIATNYVGTANPIVVGASAGSTGNQLIITNGGQVFTICEGLGSPVSGTIGNYGRNNSLILAGTNAAGLNATWNLGNDRLYLGASTTAANNWIRVDQGGIITNVSILSYGTNNSLIITNGGQVFVTGCNIGRQGLGDSCIVAGADNAGNLATLTFDSGNLQIGGNNLDASYSGTNDWVWVGPGGIITNGIGYVVVGNNTNAYANYLMVTNGGQVFSSANSLIGGYVRANSNYVIIGGGTNSSLWDLGNYSLTLGNSATASNNYVTLLSSGSLASAASVVLGGVNSRLNFNGGTLQAAVNGDLIATNSFTLNATCLVQSAGAVIDDGSQVIDVQLPLLQDPGSPGGGLMKLGAGTLTLLFTNTYTGPTLVSAGTLALSGSASLAASPNITVAGGAGLDASGLSGGFALGANQTLSNSAVGASLAGNIDGSSGSLALTYDGTNACFSIGNGTLTLASNTVFTLNLTGPTLSRSSYKLIANSSTGGTGLVAGAVPTNVTYTGASMAGTPLLQIVAGELYLGVGGQSSGISYGPTTFTYNGSAQSPSITFIGSTGTRTTNFVGVAPTVYGPSTKAPTNAGTYYMTNTVAADATYFGATDSTLFRINPAGTVNFSATNLGQVVNPAFDGLSYEKTMLTKSLFVATNTALINMYAQIAPAVFRIGANGVDTTCWGGLSNLTAITPTQVDAFAGFIKALPTNWHVIYGINMSVNNPTNCAAEAAYVANALGSSLLGFEIGNECDLYKGNGFRPTSYTFNNFLSEWRALAAAITNTVPGWAVTNGGNGWNLTGPVSAYNTAGYTVPFATNEAGVISMVTQHYYRGNATNPASTMSLLLSPDTSLPGTATTIVAAATSAHLSQGFRMDECGSFYNGGNTISSSYGAALWTLDYMFTLATNGCQGVNFHGGGQSYSSYTPIADNGVSVVMARPEFYGLKLFSLATKGGSTLPTSTTIGTNFNFTAYAVRQAAGVNGAVLVNKETNYSVTVTINLGSNVVAALPMLLAGPALSSSSGYTLGGATINPDGSWAGGFQPMAPTTNGQLTVTVPPITALWLNPLTQGTNILLANDADGTSSFTGATNWTDGLAPHGFANYFTSTNLLQTPTSGSGLTFAGDALTLGPAAPGNTSFRLAFAAPGGACTINRCTLAGGIIDVGAANATNYLSGTNWQVTAASGFGLGGDNTRAIVLSNLNLSGTSTLSNGVAGSGSGTVVYAGNAANFSGPVVTSFGTTLQAYAQTNLGGNPASFNAGQFVLDNGIFQPLASMTLTNANSGVTLNTGGGTFNVGPGLALTIGNPITGTGGLTNQGGGQLVLTGTNTYTGPTTINAGMLLVNGNSIACTNMVTVSSNAAFGGFGVMGGNVVLNRGGQLTPGGLNTVGTLTLTNTLALNGGALYYQMANLTGGTNDLVVVGSSLSLGATNTIFLSGGAPAGNYTLMTYAATNGPGTFVLAASYPNVSLAVNPTSLVLQVGAGGSAFGLTWSGSVNGTWDTAALNWTSGIAATNFNTGDNVVFDDTLARNPIVTNAAPGATVSPGSVTFNNNLTNYTINANIAGTGSLSLFGSAAVTLAGTNTYGGNTTVNAGTLVVTNGGAINSPAGTLNIGAGAGVATTTLAGGGSVTVASLLATNVVCGGVTGSILNFSGGTLTTSNNNGLAANILLASNANFYIAGNWNLNGGTNLISNVATNSNPAASVFIASNLNNLQITVNSNAVWRHAIPANSKATNILTLVFGAGNATNNVFTVNGGSLIVTNNKGDKTPITIGNAAGSTGNLLVITNGGQVLSDCRQEGGVPAGIIGSSGYNNGVIVTGTNAAGRKSAWNMVSDRLQINGSSVSTSNNWVRVDQNGVITNSTLMMYYNYSSLFITNGGQFFAVNATVGRSGLNDSLVVGGTDAAGNKATLAFITGGILTIGGGSVSASNPGTNTLVRVDQGGLMTNVTSIYVGGNNNAFDSNCLANALIITNGGQVFGTGSNVVGFLAGSSSNYVTIGGGTGGSLWKFNNTSLTIGNNKNASNNFVTLFTGGVLTNVSSVIFGGAYSVLNFNGGTLAAGTNGYLITTNGNALNATNYVQAAGAIIDSVTFNVTNRLPLLQDPNSPGGGLTKLGAGTLTLLGTNNYTGNTTVSAGTLSIQQPTIATNSTVTVAGGAVLNLAFAITNQVTGLVLNGVSQSAGVYSSTTAAPYLTGAGSLQVIGGVAVSANAYLTSLALTPAGTLTPSFATNVFSYTATEAYGNNPAVIVTNADLTATNLLIYNNTTNPLVSGVTSGALTLNPNPSVTNIVTVQVTAQDGQTVMTYVVNVQQLLSQNPPALTNRLIGTNLTLVWPLANLGYKLLVQTNNLAGGISSNTNDWMIVPNSTLTNQMPLPINSIIPGEYYRLVSP